ncbi:MAG: hypothetical protein JSR85_07160 [Proteobacteria bacterium]|nr:hypothetical protein [Pseudomonadota bacterium]
MMKNNILVSLFVFLGMNSILAHPSLFSREGQISSLNTTEELNQRDEDIFISGLIYFDQEHWCLWVNAKMMTPEAERKIGNYYLESVTPHYAEFSYTSSQLAEKKFLRIRPQQAPIIGEKKIVDEMKN